MKGISLLVNACFHTLVYSLLFLSNSSFFFLSFLRHFPLFFLFSCGVVMFTLAFLSCCSILLVFSIPPSPCTRQKAFLYCLPWKVFTVLPLNYFFLGVGILLDHPLVCQLLSHHHLPVLAVPHPITKQRVLFYLLAHRGILIQKRVGILSHYLLWHAPSDSNSSFIFLGNM